MPGTDATTTAGGGDLKRGLLCSVPEIMGIAEAWRGLLQTQALPCADQHPQALALDAARSPQRRPRVIVQYRQDKLAGIAPLMIQEDWPLRWGLQKIGVRGSVAEFRLRLADFCGPDFVGQLDGGGAEDLLSGLLKECADCDAIRFTGVAADSWVLRLLRHGQPLIRRYSIFRQRTNCRRWLVRIDRDYDEYLRKFGGGTRRKIRQKVRRLQSHFGGRVELAKALDRASLPSFFRAVNAVGCSSWQGRPLSPEAEARLAALAEVGWLRGYVLVAGDRPLAFLIGQQVDGVYQPVSTGFDISLEEYSPGYVLWSRVIQDLHQDGGFRWLDFGSGDLAYKEFWGTESYLESGVYLIQRGFRRALAFWPMRVAVWPVNIGRWFAAATKRRYDFDRLLHRSAKAFRRRA